MIGFVGCKRHYNREDEPEVGDLSAKLQSQTFGSLDCREFRHLGTDNMSSLRNEEIELNRLR